MPVGRQAKHETCVRGMAMMLSTLSSLPTPSWLLGLVTECLRPLPFFSPRVTGPESRYQCNEQKRSLLARSPKAPLWPADHEGPRTENKNRISRDVESLANLPGLSRPYYSCIRLYRSCRMRPSDMGRCPFPGTSLRLREAVQVPSR